LTLVAPRVLVATSSIALEARNLVGALAGPANILDRVCTRCTALVAVQLAFSITGLAGSVDDVDTSHAPRTLVLNVAHNDEY